MNVRIGRNSGTGSGFLRAMRVIVAAILLAWPLAGAAPASAAPASPAEQEPNDTWRQANPVRDSVDGEISDKFDEDYYAIQAARGEVIKIHACRYQPCPGDGCAAALIARLLVFDRDGTTMLAMHDDYGAGCCRASFVAPADGTYFVSVSRYYHWGWGEYHLGIERAQIMGNVTHDCAYARGIRVELYQAAGTEWQLVGSRAADCSGGYAFAGLPAGTYRVRAVDARVGAYDPYEAAWYRAVGSAGATSIQVGAGGATCADIRMRHVLYPDDSSEFAHVGAWTELARPGFDGGIAHTIAYAAGAQFVVPFEGSGIEWIGARTTSGGKANVYLDGVLRATVDQYAPVSAFQQVMWSVSGLDNGQHTLLIVPTSARNPRAIGYSTWVDGFRIEGRPASAPPL